MSESLITDALTEYVLATKIPIHIFHERELLFSANLATPVQLYNLPLYLFSSLPENLPDAWITVTTEKLYLGGLRIQRTNETLLFGPVFPTDCTLKQAQVILQRLGQKKRDYMDFRQQLNLIAHIDVPQLRHHVSLLYLMLNHTAIDEVENIAFTWHTFITSQLPVILNNEENLQDKYTNTYIEDHIVDCVRHGKTEDLIRFFNQRLALQSSDENASIGIDLRKAYVYGANIMLSRVARAEGTDITTVNTLSDYYLNQIYDATSVSTLDYLFYQLASHYTEEVRKIKKLHTDSTLTNKVGAYIQSHIYDKLSTNSIAQALNFSPSYLCSEFKKATGTTITKYLTQCKIEEAKYLLKRDEYSVTDIADILQFSSVPYFCNIFKKTTGLTPKEWKCKQQIV